MREFQEKKRVKRLLYSGVVIGLFFVLTFLVSSATWGVYKKYEETKESADIVSRKLIELQKRDGKVSEEISRLKTERGIEEEIRKKFGFTREGEGIIIVTNPPQDNDDIQSEQSVNSIIGSVWKGFLSIFKRD